MFAVFKTGGKQYRVAAEDVLKVGKVKGEPGEIVEFGGSPSRIADAGLILPCFGVPVSASNPNP